MSFEETWGKADPDATGGNDDLEPPADGLYDVALIDASAFTAKSSGDPFVKLQWRVVSAREQGHEWTVLLGFKSQAQANMTKRAVRDLGVPVDQVGSLDALDQALNVVVGQYYTVEVKTNGKFRNTYLQEGGPVTPVGSDIPAPDMQAVMTAVQTPDGDSVPF